MGFRKTLTSLVTVLPLLLSPGGFACEIRCAVSIADLAGAKTQGAERQVSSMRNMPEHTCCGSLSPVLRTPCLSMGAASQADILLEPAGIAVRSFASTPAVIPALSPAVNFALTASVALRGPPKFRTATTIFQHTILRV